jgi:Domain of unknown function (DUF4082)
MRRPLTSRFTLLLLAALFVAGLTLSVGGAGATSPCPCSLFASDTPASTGNPTQDNRPGPGPFSYEFGARFSVSQPALLTGIAFYKDAAETGSHVGTLWSDSGSQLAQTTFSGESASGRQEQSFATPVSLDPGTTYVVSVGINASFAMTRQGLASGASNGPLSVPAGGGVFADAAGQFPTSTFDDSNYFVAPIVDLPAAPATPPSTDSSSTPPPSLPAPKDPPAPARAGYCDPKTGTFYDLVAGQDAQAPYAALGLVPAHTESDGAIDCAFPPLDNGVTLTTASVTPPLALVVSVVRSSVPRWWLVAQPQGATPDKLQLAERTDTPWSWRTWLPRFSLRTSGHTIFIRFAKGDQISDWQAVSLTLNR